MKPIPNILVLYAHPTPHHSRINQRMADSVASLAHVHLHDLYETYPDFHIAVRREQSLVAAADLIVFQHPIQWYSMPALLKQWVDMVLTPGWAYGPDGNALRGKDFWLVATTGGSEASYREEGHNRLPFSVFLPPYQQTAQLCGMRWLPPHILHGAHQANEAALLAHIDLYRERLATYPHWPELQTINGSPSSTHEVD
ncbi:glutathione-regulated potassium-efflux system oxidoreductase KefF [Glaciimonas soli]|uniref:glutathione-regulated potassium-efflux system oxidoreductase KefF n=1 Tax=Glaciimonas soli TaxID=2590999 RepID=UPI001292F9A1|nr:NAD(P)H-dependent oxidoreductase [Glaciimonas soli]